MNLLKNYTATHREWKGNAGELEGIEKVVRKIQRMMKKELTKNKLRHSIEI